MRSRTSVAPAVATESGPGPGHNLPEGFVEADPELLRSRLDHKYAGLLARLAEIEVGAGQTPQVIEDEGTAQRVVDWIAQQVRPAVTDLKTAHKKEKGPYLECGKAIDSFFLRPADKATLLIGAISQRTEVFFQRKKAEQRRREQEARDAALATQREAEAERARLIAAANEKASTERAEANRLMAQAAAEETRAAEAAKAAAAPSAPVRIHGDYGATAYEKEKWTFEVEDPSKIPLGYLMPDEDAIQGAINEGVREIPGIRIYQTGKLIFRRC